MSNQISMPIGTAVWLIEHTSLTFEQIAHFCNLHPLEIYRLADATEPVVGVDPIATGQLSKEEIERCLLHPQERLQQVKNHLLESSSITKASRTDKLAVVLWLLKNYPKISDKQILAIVSTTKNTIQQIRTKNHKKYDSITPLNPVLAGLLGKEDLEQILADLC